MWRVWEAWRVWFLLQLMFSTLDRFFYKLSLMCLEMEGYCSRKKWKAKKVKVNDE